MLHTIFLFDRIAEIARTAPGSALRHETCLILRSRSTEPVVLASILPNILGRTKSEEERLPGVLSIVGSLKSRSISIFGITRYCMHGIIAVLIGQFVRPRKVAAVVFASCCAAARVLTARSTAPQETACVGRNPPPIGILCSFRLDIRMASALSDTCSSICVRCFGSHSSFRLLCETSSVRSAQPLGLDLTESRSGVCVSKVYAGCSAERQGIRCALAPARDLSVVCVFVCVYICLCAIAHVFSRLKPPTPVHVTTACVLNGSYAPFNVFYPV